MARPRNNEDEDDWKGEVRSLERFLSLRQLCGHPVTIVNNLEGEFIQAERRWKVPW